MQPAGLASSNVSPSHFDVRPIRPTSPDAPLMRAVTARDHIATVVRETLARECVDALVYESQAGNYPPWVKLEAWLPKPGDDPAIRQRSELEFVVDARPYHKSNLVWSMRLTRGATRRNFFEQPSLTRAQVEGWTRYALDRGPTAKYSSFGIGNPIAISFESGFWPLLVLAYVFAFFVVLMTATRNREISTGLIAALIVATGVIAFQTRRRVRVLAVTPEPVIAPRRLALVDSWNSAVACLGLDLETTKRRIFTRVTAARGLGAECALEVQSHRTPNGYEQREHFVVSKGQSHVHVHIHPFGRDLFVGWQAFLN